ncbi:hypothetical protein GCM10007332_08780 [Epilithonimonas arachidiradicis]|nr:hypothetical protein GCM10007332_08780 [Epilithonimonas arachidiradicis]
MIPILFWFYGNRKFEEVNVGVIDIVLPAKVHSTSSKEEKDRIYQNSFEPLRNWDYKKIVVKPNTARQNSDFYISEIKNLQQRNVKETGIEFIINDDNSYDDLISLLNDMAISKHEMYGLDLDKSGHFFALVNYRDPNTIEMEYECLLCNDVIYDEYKPSFFDDFQFYLQKFSKESFYLVFGFLIFVNISMLSIKESLQKH